MSAEGWETYSRLTAGSIGTAPIWRRPDEILSIAHVLRNHVVLIQPSDRQYDNIHGLCNGKTVTNRPRRGGGLTGGSIGTAPIWRRPDEILSIAHVLRDHVVLIQQSDRQYGTIYMACVTVKQLQTVRGGVHSSATRLVTKHLLAPG